MATEFYIKRNDTSPQIAITAKTGAGVAIDLTGATAKFIMQDYDGNEKVNAAANITAPASGTIVYEWLAADTDTLGFYRAEFEVTYSDGSIETFPNKGFIEIEIGEDLG